MKRLLIAVAASLLAMAAFAQSTPQEFIQKAKARTGYGDYQGAIADYSEAIKYNPFDADFYNNRGQVQYVLKNYRAAVADFNKTLYLDPDMARTYVHIILFLIVLCYFLA